MSELRKIYGLWRREVLRYWREKSRIISSLIMPLLWLLVFGSGMRGIELSGTQSYQTYIFPGIVAMTLLFTSVFSGISIIWDREFGFFKEIMVAPVSRTSIVIGKALGSGTSALIQGFILLPLSFLVGVHLSPLSFVMLIPTMILISIGLVCIGLLIASMITSMEGFNFIMSLVIMPMFFTSGALFPLTSAPAWLRDFSYINPLTYGVDTLRWATFSGTSPLLPVYVEFLILALFAIAMIAACSYTFNIKK
ncbi:MAG: daunorubicin ABC transporter permease [Chloroflexi bacterium RBG_13_50_10]|nr:MAG: daunorubicin ABC transporter permease [Chloroflexi bacterium RBG_13_50_10]